MDNKKKTKPSSSYGFSKYSMPKISELLSSNSIKNTNNDTNAINVKWTFDPVDIGISNYTGDLSEEEKKYLSIIEKISNSL